MTHNFTIRGFELLDASQFETMHTGTLMRIRREMLGLPDTSSPCDLTKSEIASLDTSHTIYFKSDPRWKMLYDKLKAVLNTRENWPPTR